MTFDGLVRRGSAVLHVPAGAETLQLDTDWWFPAGAPLGLVWLQHGFTRRAHHVADLARCLAEAGALVLAPTIGSYGRFWMNGSRLQRAVADLLSGDRPGLVRAFEQAAGSVGVEPAALPARVVLSGHSAGGNLVTVVGSQLADDPRVAGLVVYDPVSRSGSMDVALAAIEGPVFAVTAPPSRCNAGGSGERALRRARPSGFVGVRLPGGTHVDAEGTSTTRAAALVCGRPGVREVATLQELGSRWTVDVLVGRASGEGYPGGRVFERLRAAGTIQAL